MQAYCPEPDLDISRKPRGQYLQCVNIAVPEFDSTVTKGNTSRPPVVVASWPQNSDNSDAL